MKKETRDQSGKLYAAEALAFQKNSEDMSIKECQQYVNKVLKRNYIQRNYPTLKEIVVLDGRGRRSACATYRHGQWVICLPKWSRNEFIILHEIAHHLVGIGSKFAHDSYFATCLLDLTRNLLGREDALTLQAAFSYKGVKVRGKNGAVKARCPKERMDWLVQKKLEADALSTKIIEKAGLK
jgi:putative metallohydrolase (TIGR04338 family)